MDSSAIRPRQPLHRSYAPRDPMPVRGVAAAELETSKAVATPDEGGDHGHRRDGSDRDERPAEHSAPQIAVDPESRDVIQRAREAAERDLRDQALLRFRAYGRAPVPKGAAGRDPKADIEA